MDTRVTAALGIEYPILQAPMAGGPTTPALVAAVSNAGGLGSLGAAYLSPETLREQVGEIRTLTDRPFNVNLFVPSPFEVDPEGIDRANALLGRTGRNSVSRLRGYRPPSRKTSTSS